MIDLATGLNRATSHLVDAQRASGAWEGEVVWNTMLLSQYVIVLRVLGRPLPPHQRDGALRYLQQTQGADGSWGMHAESAGYLFHTTLAYVAQRLLGTPPDGASTARARAWILSQPGGPLTLPSWGKFWLSMIGLYERAGLNPVPPELFLLPRWLPLSPDRLYCHTRYALLPMAYLYGRQFRCELGSIGAELRDELYPGGYAAAEFAAHRSQVAKTDLLSPPHPLVRSLAAFQHRLESVHLHPLRERALTRCLERIVFEQRTTGHLGLSPVNAILNCLALHAADSEHPELGPSVEGIRAWIWTDPETGLRLAGARSAAWDTALALRALTAAPEDERARRAVDAGAAFLRSAQLAYDVDGAAAEARERARGGWCFTEGTHNWPVSDCAAEALSALLDVGSRTGVPTLAPYRARNAVDFILSRQNRDGGFGSYERRRAGDWLEALNPSEMYADCMTEKSYTECTASCVAALARYRAVRSAPDPDIDRAIERGLRLLRRRQLGNGSFAGSWGINFTYATYHVLEAFAAAGLESDELVDHAVRWLVTTQRADGGWGEHWRGCLRGEYIEHTESQTTMTAWALLALLVAPHVPADAIERGVAFLLRTQGDGGVWPRQSPAGVFFRSAALDYTLYRAYFPLWALARASSRPEFRADVAGIAPARGS